MIEHNLSIEPITDEAILLRPGLVKIVVSRINKLTGEITKFALPVQWELKEAGELIQLIRGLTWQLSDKDNLPMDYEGIRDLCHVYLFEKVGYVQPINVKWKSKSERNTVLS